MQAVSRRIGRFSNLSGARIQSKEALIRCARHPLGSFMSFSDNAPGGEKASTIALCNSESPEGGYLATRTLAMPKDENMHR